MSSNSQEIDISKANAPLHIKFALVCLNKLTLPKWLGYFCFILSHIQTLAVLIKSIYIALPDNTPSASPIIKLFLKFFVVGDWMSHDNTVPLVIGTAIITIYTLKVVILMMYIHYRLFRKRRIPDVIQNYWGLVHSFHPLLIFFWIHMFCLEILKFSHENEFKRGIEVFMTAMAYLNTVVNCVLAAFFSIISVIYKTKDVMASKTNLLETKSIILKIIVPAFWRIAENNEGIQIFTLVFALLHCITHDWIFIKYLPYFRVRILLLCSVFQASKTSLTLVSCIVKLVEVNREKPNDIGVFSVQIIWLLMMPILAKVYLTITWKLLDYIFGCEIKDETNVAYLVHKRFTLLYFLKTRKVLHKGVNRFSFADVMYQARLAEVGLNSGVPFEELDMDKMLLVRSLKVICLEILRRYPKALLAQINLAYSYSKFEDMYLVSNNLLEDAISKKPGYQAQISLNMIRFELQKKLKIQFSEKGGEGLNIYSYVINQDLHEEVKSSIEKQTEMQLGFWNEFMSNEPNMMNLLNIAFEVSNQRLIVRKLWHHLLKERPGSYLSPLVVYGMYASLVNNDSIAGGKLLEQSQEDSKRMKRILKADELTNETIFSDKTVKVTMSGLRSKLGKVLDCSTNIADFYGWQGNEMKGRPMVALMPPFFRQRHDGFLLNHYHTGKTKLLNNTLVVPVKRANGYIHPSWVHAKVSPLMENGISYVGLIRPCKSSQRMVMIRTDGKIDDMSFEFAKDMGLTETECPDIFKLCPELRQINEAFNLVAETSIQINTEVSLPSLKKDFSSDALLSSFQSQQKPQDHNLIGSERSLLQHGDTTRFSERTALSRSTRFVKVETGRLKEDEEEIQTPIPSPTPIRRESIINEKSAVRRMKSMKAHAVHEKFRTGSPLTFHPQDKKEPVTYNARISNSIHGKEWIKFILLEKVSGGENEETTEDHLSEMQSSGHAHVVSSLKMKANTFPRQSILHHHHHHNLLGNHNQSSGSILEHLEGGESLELNDSTKVKILGHSKDETNLSILDEVQSNDSFARKAVFRNIVKDKTPAFGGRQKKHSHSVFFHQAAANTKLTERTKQKAHTHTQAVEKHKEEVLPQPLRIVRRGGKTAKIDENSLSSSMTSKGKKVEQLVVRALKGEPKKKSALIFLALCVLFLVFMIILLVVQNVNLQLGINDVKSQIPVISAGLFRQINMISSATQVRILKGVLQGDVSTGGGWNYDTKLFGSDLTEDLVRMKEYNSEFYELLSKLPLDLQAVFYEKNVGIYEYNEDGSDKMLVNMDSTFEAVQTMIEREYRVVNMEIPAQFESDIDTSNHKFIVDNILNDLLVKSESQIDHLISDLDDSTNSTTLKMGVTLAGVVIVCLIFIILAIRYLWVIATEARLFMMMVFRIKLQECEAMQLILQRFAFALNMNLNDGQEDLKIKERAKQDDENSRRFRQASMNSLYKTQRIAFMKLLPIYSVFICWSVIYFFLTSDFIGKMQTTQKRMEVALEALNNQTLFVNELVSVPLSNMLAIVKNEQLRPMILESFKYLQQVTVFVDHFKNENGELTALQQRVLYSFKCEDFLPYLEEDSDYIKAAYESCFVIMKEKDSVGLVSIHSELYSTGTSLLQQYDESSKSKEDLTKIFKSGLQSCDDLVNTAKGLLRLLYTKAHKDFESDVDDIRNDTIYVVIAIIVVTVIIIMMTWYFAIKKIFRIQKIDWFILKLIPIKLILNNKHIQQYLLKHSDGLLDGVKRYL